MILKARERRRCGNPEIEMNGPKIPTLAQTAKMGRSLDYELFPCARSSKVRLVNT
jgi:hypothetical protein